MRNFSPIAVSRILLVTLGVLPLPAAAQSPSRPAPVRQSQVRQIHVLGSRNAVEIQVEASEAIVPQTQVLTGPDRLVVDFPNAVPSSSLRSQSVYQGEVKDLRVGLFQARPPITRIVLDLNGPQAYQVFPGRTVIIKVAGEANEVASGVGPFVAPTRPGLVAASYSRGAERISAQPSAQTPLPATPKPLEVSFRDGLLKIRANKATLSEVLFAVQQRTGAEIGIVAGAEQEQVVVDLGPAPAPQILQQLLNGSKFNFLIVSAPDDPSHLDRVILTQRNDSLVYSRAPIPGNNAPSNPPAEDDDDAAHAAPPPPQPVPRPSQQNPMQPEPHPDLNNPPDTNPQQ